MLGSHESLSIQDLLFLAKVAEQAERYDDCVNFMEELAKRETREVSYEERSLISAAFKNLVANKRASWRALDDLRQKLRDDGDRENSHFAKKRKASTAKEIEALADRVNLLVDSVLLPKAVTTEAKIFYLKLKADYFRYVAEISRSASKQQAIESASSCYLKASELAHSDLSPNHPIRLAVALNYSVFLNDIADQALRAKAMARSAYEDAISGLDNVADESYKDSTLIISLLRDNLALWANDAQD